MLAMKSWVQTHTGVRFNVVKPTQDMVKTEDICHALSHVNRFSGHTRRPYSVAEHSLLVYRLVDTGPLQLEALLHDATEAYLGDVPTPVKNLCPCYLDLEYEVRKAIADAYALQDEPPDAVHIADMQALLIEKEALMEEQLDWGILGVAKHPDHDMWCDILATRDAKPAVWAQRLAWEIDACLGLP